MTPAGSMAEMFRLFGLKENCMSVTRRGFLHRSAALVGGIGLASLLTEKAYAKMAQKQVAYQESPHNGQTCANCKLFQPPNACQLVEGVISPNGWCKLWIKAG
jgi:High potential iron-sulfur protein